MTEDNCRVDCIQRLMDAFRTSRALLAFGPRKFRRFDFTGGVDAKMTFRPARKGGDPNRASSEFGIRPFE
jgi:hypothetical protein